MIVVDTNVLAYTVIAGKMTSMAEGVLEIDDQWSAPMLWRSEFRNLLALQVRSRSMPLDEAKQYLRFAEMRMRDREHSVDSEAVLDCSAQSGMSAYDCEFVVLARRLGVLLVTADRKLARAFPDRARLLAEFIG